MRPLIPGPGALTKDGKISPEIFPPLKMRRCAATQSSNRKAPGRQTNERVEKNIGEVRKTAVRAALFCAGFLRAPQREPVPLVGRIQSTRKDLAKFTALKSWYLTAGDGDLELHP
jgi:hypothetical protein